METCRTCEEPYSEFGDGWDGECPDCADRSYAREFCGDCGNRKPCEECAS